jgi:tRNA-dihydrouridine synthase B
MGEAEYDTIAAIKAAVTIPVIANGDIDSPEKAKQVLAHTGVDGLMIGRAAQGRPWIFREIEHYLKTGEKLPEPGPHEVRAILLGHLENLYAFYGEHLGVRVARKHISWYSKGCVGGSAFRHAINQVESTTGQRSMIEEFFARQADLGGKAAPAFVQCMEPHSLTASRSALLPSMDGVMPREDRSPERPPSMAVAATPAGLAA